MDEAAGAGIEGADGDIEGVVYDREIVKGICAQGEAKIGVEAFGAGGKAAREELGDGCGIERNEDAGSARGGDVDGDDVAAFGTKLDLHTAEKPGATEGGAAQLRGLECEEIAK